MPIYILERDILEAPDDTKAVIAIETYGRARKGYKDNNMQNMRKQVSGWTGIFTRFVRRAAMLGWMR